MEKYDPLLSERQLELHELEVKRAADTFIARINKGDFKDLDWRVTEDVLAEIRNPDEEAERDEGLTPF
jgi:hypothetical protein